MLRLDDWQGLATAVAAGLALSAMVMLVAWPIRPAAS
jgi:hypothetical protein